MGVYIMNKKGIGAVIATLLLLIIVIVATINFQIWLYNFSSKTNTQIESQNLDFQSQIETVIENIVYFNSKEKNITIEKIIIGNKTCSNISSQNLLVGINKINVKNCIENLSNSEVEIVIITNNNLYTKKIFIKNNQYLNTTLTEANINPLIYFTSQTPENNSINLDKSFETEAIINISNLSKIIYNFNNSFYNCSIYNSMVIGDNSCTDYLNENLILALNFDEGINNLTDLSQNGNEGSNLGAIWTSNGKYGGAYTFNGIDYAPITSKIELNPTNFTSLTDISIGVWIFKLNTSNNPILSLSDATTSYESYLFMIGSDDKIRVSIKHLDSFIFGFAVDAPLILPNKWYYLNLIMGSEGNSIYVNGEKINSSQITYSTGNEDSTYSFNSVSNIDSILIGARDLGHGSSASNDYDYTFNGTIDEFHIYDKCLSANEIKQLYNSNLKKYSDSKWEFHINNTNLTSGIYNYQVLAKDNFENIKSTEKRTIIIS